MKSRSKLLPARTWLGETLMIMSFVMWADSGKFMSGLRNGLGSQKEVVFDGYAFPEMEK